MQITYRFVSVLNEQGFIEGRYVPVVDGKSVASEAGDSAVVEARLSEPLNVGDGQEAGSNGSASGTIVEPAPAK